MGFARPSANNWSVTRVDPVFLFFFSVAIFFCSVGFRLLKGGVGSYPGTFWEGILEEGAPRTRAHAMVSADGSRHRLLARAVTGAVAEGLPRFRTECGHGRVQPVARVAPHLRDLHQSGSSVARLRLGIRS